jgi:hypothetical protein
MKRAMALCAVVVAVAGCGVSRGPDMGDLMKRQQDAMASQDTMLAKSQLMQEMMANPDLPAWHEQREKMALALGDRQFDKPFDRVFDSMTVALATLGCRVQNMERVSGYITASIPELPPTQLESLSRDATRQYAVAKGYPASIVDKSNSPYDLNLDIGSLMNRQMAGLTLSMVKQGPEMTKVKLRFDNVYYPGLVDEYYKVVWAAVDKQMFLDKGLD